MRWETFDSVSVSVSQRMYVVVEQKLFVVDAVETFLGHFARRYYVPARSERPELARRLIALIKHAKVIFVSEVFLDIRILNALCLAIGVCRVARRRV